MGQGGRETSLKMSPKPYPPLHLESCRIRDFRNLQVVQFEPGEGVNVLYGANGQGKTNILEACYCATSLRSFRGAKADEMVSAGKQRARIELSFRDGALHRSLSVALQVGVAKQARLDGKRAPNAFAHYSALPMVIFDVGDIGLVNGEPEQRRYFLDRLLEQTDAVYVEAQRTYLRALRNRNRMLKSETFDPRMLRSFDQILADAGEVIVSARRRAISDVSAAFTAIASSANLTPLEVHFEYVEKRVAGQSLLEVLQRNVERDRARGFTGAGPHADDLVIVTQGRRAKRFVSQGQSRLIALCLKLAEAYTLADYVKRMPLFLVDDFSSELDAERREAFLGALTKLQGQTFVTTTDPDLGGLIGRPACLFELNNGSIKTP